MQVVGGAEMSGEAVTQQVLLEVMERGREGLAAASAGSSSWRRWLEALPLRVGESEAVAAVAWALQQQWRAAAGAKGAGSDLGERAGRFLSTLHLLFASSTLNHDEWTQRQRWVSTAHKPQVRQIIAASKHPR